MFKLIDMKRKAKKLRKLAEVPTTGSRVEKPYYAHGTKITLEDEELKKLNKKVGDFKVGDDVDIISKAKVTSTDISEDEFDNNRYRVGLQLRKMRLGK